MTEQTPAGQAAAEEAPAVPPAKTSQTAAASGRAAELEGELARIRAAAVAGATVLMRLDPEGPHSGFTVGHTTVTQEPTTVPASVVESLLTAAAEAGVRLISMEE